MLKALILSSFLLLTSCTDAYWDQYATLGSRAEIKCYSNRLVFHALSTGKVKNETQSDGYFARWQVIYAEGSEWKHVDLSKPVAGSVSGHCIILYVD
jgi:hypothetical protein